MNHTTPPERRNDGTYRRQTERRGDAQPYTGPERRKHDRREFADRRGA